MRNVIEVWENPDYDYIENGRSISIRVNLPFKPPKDFSIKEIPSKPLDDTYTLINTVTAPFGDKLFYDVIPGDMLYTQVSNSQVRIQVDHNEAVCVNNNCNYKYTDPDAVCTSLSVTGVSGSHSLTVNCNAALPIGCSVELAGAICENYETDGTN